jgi:Zn-finger nucleic acid-binding protein
MPEAVLACPSCARPMRKEVFERKIGGEMPIDICPPCRLIWFDPYESLQLTSAGLLEMFKLIHAHERDPANQIPNVLDCPRCGSRLVLTHDVQRSTRFVYYRCQQGHGRLTAFLQFLREKNFVRTLSVSEVNHLREDVKQVQCSSCGAPINLATDSACGFCKAPIEILDGNAMRAALESLAADEREHLEMGAKLESVESMFAAHDPARSGAAPDLLGIGIGLVANGFRPRS